MFSESTRKIPRHSTFKPQKIPDIQIEDKIVTLQQMQNKELISSPETGKIQTIEQLILQKLGHIYYYHYYYYYIDKVINTIDVWEK